MVRIYKEIIGDKGWVGFFSLGRYVAYPSHSLTLDNLFGVLPWIAVGWLDVCFSATWRSRGV